MRHDEYTVSDMTLKELTRKYGAEAGEVMRNLTAQHRNMVDHLENIRQGVRDSGVMNDDLEARFELAVMALLADTYRIRF